MKISVKRAITDQKGAAALTMVLILLVLGGLILTPLLGLMSTGLMSGQVYENKMQEYYAADAGIEDAVWRLVNDDWLPSYRLDELRGLVNGKEVAVTIESIWLLKDLPPDLQYVGLPSDPPELGDDNYGNDHWAVTGAINIDNTANYIIDITSDETNAGDVDVDHIGVWLPRGYSYVDGSTKINGVAIGEDDLIKDPDPLEGIPYKEGTLLIWDFGGANFTALSDISQPAEGGCTPAEKFPPSVRLSFDYTSAGAGEAPEEPGDEPGTAEYTVPGSYAFPVPAGVTSVTVEAWGGGGGGGGRSSSDSGGAGGGGGGAYARDIVAVTGGTTYPVTVGAGGSGGSGGDRNGSDGGDSWFGSQSTVLADGGRGGYGGEGGQGGHGGEVYASVGSVRIPGGDGASGRSYDPYRSGGGGGGAGNVTAGEDAYRTSGGGGGVQGGGDGADGRTDNGAGYPGFTPGGGGSGAQRTSGGPYAGGDGAPGKVIVRYQGASPEEPEEPGIAKGFFSWIKLGDADDSIAWDSEAGIFHIISQAAADLDIGVQAGGTIVDTYTVRGFTRYVGGTGGGTATAAKGDYIAIGNSLMSSAWLSRTGDNCDGSGWGNDPFRFTDPVLDPNYSETYYVDICRNIRGSLWQESSATVNPDMNFDIVPEDATVEKAYVYWTAYLEDSDQPDREVTLRVTDPQGSSGETTVEAKRSYVVDVPRVGGWQYSCFADVTSQVKAITTDVNGVTFTVGRVSATPAEEAGPNTGWNEYANAGWSMIIIYSSQKKETHQIYLYDSKPLALQGTSSFFGGWEPVSVVFNVTGFEAPELEEGDMDAQLAVFVAEGDPHYSPDYLKFNGTQLGDNNVFNGYSTATGFAPSSLLGQDEGTISGVDIDVYAVSDYVDAGDIAATIGLQTEVDYIMLVYVVFSVLSDVVHGEGFDVGTMTYEIG